MVWQTIPYSNNSICKLFRTSLDEGVLPQEWKEAKVTPIFKKGSRNNVENYRPTSLTSVCCKIMEKIIRNAVLHHMISNQHLSDDQLIRSRSCTTQLIKVVDKLSEILNNREDVDMIY